MPIVDSHCHASSVWYEPVESLLFQMERSGVDHAVLIQIMGQTNNEYQFECVRQFPGRFSTVVLVDAERSDAVDELSRLADSGASGVRLRPSTRSPGDDPLAIWRAAARLGLSVSCGGSAVEFADEGFAALIAELSELKIVIEHLGSVNRPDGEDAPFPIRRRVFDLARFPNAYMKVPGLGEFVRRAMPVTEPFPFVEPVPPLLDEALAAFGAGRLMWGSDFPPVSSREGYRLALNLPRRQLSGRTAEELDAIFGGTALSVFPIRV